MANLFRTVAPTRTCIKKYADFHKYKQNLADDFNHKCGYTDCSDAWFGGKITFQIDHIKPKSKYPQLENDYSNLVYCCSYVNILKSNDKGPFSDPCKVDYNKLFYRDDMGRIFPIKESDSAVYMYFRMRLYMARYGIIWLLDQLEQRMGKIAKIIERGNLDPDLSLLLANLVSEHEKYKKYLCKTL